VDELASGILLVLMFKQNCQEMFEFL